MRRSFNTSQRIALYLASGGVCSGCGVELARGWHGDHVQPYSKGGATVVENGQALCPICNQKKGNKMTRFFRGDHPATQSWGVKLRDYQLSCLGKFIEKMNAGQTTLAIAAVMGAGKTILSLRWLHLLLSRKTVRVGVVVVPTDNLRLQFCRDAKIAGLHAYAITSTPDKNTDLALRVSCIPGFDGPLPSDAHLIVITYAQLAIEANVTALRALCAECSTAWVFDEVHHSGDSTETDPALSWGDGMSRAAEQATYRILTTATPNRTDGRPIPFLRYMGSMPQFDFVYDYEQALLDGHVRVVDFVFMNGLAAWWTAKDGDLKAQLTDPIPREHYSKRLNTIVNADHQWVSESLDIGVHLLRDMRTQGRHKDAGGLVVVKNKQEAKKVATLLSNKGARGVVVVTYDDPEASTKIDAFRKSDDEWIIAVRMISEGIDIRRLRVLVYATTVTTELLFLQILGRVLRIIPGILPQLAHIIIPPDPRLMKTVDTYRSIIMRALKEKGTGPGPNIQEQIWYQHGASGFEDGRRYNTDDIDQYWVDRATTYCVGNADVTSLIALALKSEAQTAPPPPPSHVPPPSKQAWDTAKHQTYEDIKNARSRLIGLRIASGRYDKSSASKSVNSDLYDVFGPIDQVRHDDVLAQRYLTHLHRMLEKEGGSASV